MRHVRPPRAHTLDPTRTRVRSESGRSQEGSHKRRQTIVALVNGRLTHLLLRCEVQIVKPLVRLELLFVAV